MEPRKIPTSVKKALKGPARTDFIISGATKLQIANPQIGNASRNRRRRGIER